MHLGLSVVIALTQWAHIVGATSIGRFCLRTPGRPCLGHKTTLTEATGAENPFDGINVVHRSFPKVVDWDNDGLMDVAVGEHEGTIRFYRQLSDGSLSEQRGADNPFDGIDVGRLSVPEIVDWDRDGLMDLVIGSKDFDESTIRYYRQRSDGSLSEQTGADNPFDGIRVRWGGTVPKFVDWDSDGLMDLAIGESGGTIGFYRQLSDGSLSEQTGADNPFHGIDVGLTAVPEFVDWDRDGLMDFVSGSGDYPSVIRYFRQHSDGTLSEQTGAANPFNGIGINTGEIVIANVVPEFVDWDSNGLMDLAVGHSSGTIRYYWQLSDESISEQPSAANPFVGISVGEYSFPEFVDWDSDGLIDLAIGGQEIKYYRQGCRQR
eukprot:TRINITY_DN14767_c0_g2_i1.p1 TRINITY_DN14767_c0_g2~~TRINITY_DN14767_c0_g2_i1.p1  ORF type:complete len:392 (+),score=57.37 TRINITY_DN14767_c0_g2_i1:51-1178(+)